MLDKFSPHFFAHPGILTHSSGNHGQAVAYASSIAALPSIVVVTKNTPKVKARLRRRIHLAFPLITIAFLQTSAIEGYGAEVVKCDTSPSSRVEVCKKIAEEKPGFKMVPSSDHVDVIAGQGTIALELHEQVT